MPVVLDYDGNLTKAEQEGLPFIAGFAGDMAKIVRQPVLEVQRELDRLTAEALAADPANFGWNFGKDGWIMCPAQVDPYQRSSAAGRRLLRSMGVPEPLINGMLDLLFGYNYKKTADVPKEETADLLVTIHAREIPSAVVTNSGTSDVVEKVRRLLSEMNLSKDWWIDRVYGSARKMDPDECITHMPDGTPITREEDRVLWDPSLPIKLRYDGFPRDTVIKRPHYLKRLRALKAAWEKRLGRFLQWDEILVVGDIFELDLVVPLELGCHVGFMVNHVSPAWEVAYVDHHARGRVLDNVGEILPYYDEVQSRRAA